MTPDQQLIAIAEACGLTNVHLEVIKNVHFQGDDRVIGIISDQGWIPDYLTDLNAMHEAEKVLHKDVQLYLRYMRELSVECGGEGDAIFANATQGI